MNAETLTHAWTVRQPFAYAVAAGWKPVENKTERPPLALIGKLVGIHAGLQWARIKDQPSWPTQLHTWPGPDDPRLTFGALIGVARLVGVVRHPPGTSFVLMRGRSHVQPLPLEICDRIRPWWRGPWGWLFEEAALLPEPIPMRGQQGLWRLSPVAVFGTSRGGLTASDLALTQWRKAREEKR